MSRYSRLVIRALDSMHDRKSFNSGSQPLDDYLQKQASQDVRRRISRVFVASPEGYDNEVVGYYTLSSLSIAQLQLPQTHVHKLPRHPIPAALIGRLAVDQSAQGNGVGALLLLSADAINRTLAVSHDIAIYAMVVDAINNEAQQFYQYFGFTKFSSESNRLFLPLKGIKF